MPGEAWKQFPLQDVIDFQEGPGILARDFRPAGVPLIRLAGLERDASILAGCNFLDEETVKERWSHFRLRAGDTLLSTSATLGRISVVDDRGVGAIPYTGIIRMRPKTADVFSEFIPYLLESPAFQQQVEEMGVGSVIRHFGPTHLRQMTVTLPPVRKQRAIAAILGALDAGAELHRRVNRTLEATAQALFKSWFIDFDPVRTKIESRNSGLPQPVADLFPDSLQDSELGQVPKGWCVAPLKEHVVAVKGLSYKGSGLGPTGVPLHNLNSVYEGGGYKYEGIKYYNGEYRDRHVVQPGDVIVANTEQGHDLRLIGYPAVVPAQFGSWGLFSHHLFRVRPRPDSPLTRRFIYLMLMAPQVRGQITGHTNGTTVNMLSVSGLEMPMVIVPPREIVEKFEELVAPMFRRMELSVGLSSTLAATRDALLPKLVSGELRIRDAERILRDLV